MKKYDYEKEHRDQLRNRLAECMVLLEKNGAFPLEKPGTLAAYGNGIRCGGKGGTGSGDVNARTVTGIEEGLQAAGFHIINGHWLDQYEEHRKEAKKAFRKRLKKEAKESGVSLVIHALGAIMEESDYEFGLDYRADAAIYVLSRVSGEGTDRKVRPGDVLLTRSEIRDILALNEHYARFMLVLNTGGPVDLTPVSKVANILILSQLGSEMGNALADVLLGRANPSGKLATTWAAPEDYCAEIEFGAADDTCYREGIYVGYRYFDTVGRKALYPFGYGLSYTEFALETVQVRVEERRVNCDVCVRNTGSMAGREVVQVYVTAPEKDLKKPWQELAGFAKTEELAPQASEHVTVFFDMADIASYDERKQAYVLEKGTYIVRVGNCSRDTQPAAKIILPETVIVRTVRPVAGTAGFEEFCYERAATAEELNDIPGLWLDPASFTTKETVYDKPQEIAEEIHKLSDEELAYMAVGHFPDKGGIRSMIGSASSHVAGAAGETTSRLEDHGIRPLIMADGPAGLRLSRDYYTDKKGIHPIGAGSIPESLLDVLSPVLRKMILALTSGRKPSEKAEIKHQYCTALPIGTAIAQTWNTEFAQMCGDIVGDEMTRFGVDLWLAPALNIHRSILCGRNFEYFSEDPLMSGQMAAAITRGVQAHPGKGAVIKHFAANNQEYNRYYNNSRISERALREIYLRGFRICMDESGPYALMTSYNLLNGIHTSESKGLIEDYLRSECGFEGIIMTDWVLPVSNYGKRYSAARVDRVAAAGGGLFMPGSRKDYRQVLHALRKGELSRKQLETNASRVSDLSRRLSALTKNADNMESA